MDEKTIENNFTYHAPSVERASSHEFIRATALNLAYMINGERPDSREKSLALTRLEECVMWANAAIARNE